MLKSRRVLAIGTGVLVVGAGVAVFGTSGMRHTVHPPPPPSSEHGAGIDRIMSAYAALYHAPEGATPCESAYNAFKASQDFAADAGVTPVVLRLAPREDFLQRCSSLPPASQKCVVPLYLSDHRTECQSVKPGDEVLAAMVEMKRTKPPGGPAEPPP